MKLFYAPGACSIGIHVMLEEIGAPYEAVAVNLREGAQFQPGFTAVNPLLERIRTQFFRNDQPRLPGGRQSRQPRGEEGVELLLAHANRWV